MSRDKLREIRQHWEKAAAAPRDEAGLRPTARDPYLQEVVATAMERHLYPGAKLLDLGCGDGLTTLRFAAITGDALGVDYIQDFVQLARRNAQKSGVRNAAFEPADVLDLEAIRQQHGLFDIVTSIRCLINLPDWPHQTLAIRQVSQIVRPGGLYLASEGWKEGLEGLNLCRQRVGLDQIAVARYNLMISRPHFEEEVRRYFSILEYINLGLYSLISRVIQPMYTRPDSPSHTHPLNKIAAEMVNANVGCNSFEFCDYSGVYILRRCKDS